MAACGALHLTEAQFYRLTPRKFSMLIEMHQLQQIRHEYPAGVIAAAMCGGSPQDYMPSMIAGEQAEVPSPPSDGGFDAFFRRSQSIGAKFERKTE